MENTTNGPVLDYDPWEYKVATELQFFRGGTFYSAQKILALNGAFLKQAWCLGKTPVQAAKRLYIQNP